MKNINVFHVLFLIVIPIGVVLYLYSNEVINKFNTLFGIAMNIGDVVIIYAVISIMAFKFAIQNRKDKDQEN